MMARRQMPTESKIELRECLLSISLCNLEIERSCASCRWMSKKRAFLMKPKDILGSISQPNSTTSSADQSTFERRKIACFFGYKEAGTCIRRSPTCVRLEKVSVTISSQFPHSRIQLLNECSLQTLFCMTLFYTMDVNQWLAMSPFRSIFNVCNTAY